MPYDFDVVILSFDRPGMTIEAINSVRAQQDNSAKIWVIDQGSDPLTVEELLARYEAIPEVSIIQLEKNLGVAGGRTYGMELGEGMYIISIDNDAVIEDGDLFSRVKRKFEHDSELGIIGFRINNFYSRNLDTSSWAYAKKMLNQADKEFLATRFCGAGHAIRRKLIDECGGYDEKLFFYWEELDLSYKAIDRGYKVLYSPEFEVWHKISPDRRVAWDGGRFYYLVRNALYLDWKYFRSIPKFFIRSLGYLLKGIYNRIALEAGTGIIDAVRFISQENLKKYKLGQEAISYINTHDLASRGNLFQRIFSEVFVDLNGT